MPTELVGLELGFALGALVAKPKLVLFILSFEVAAPFQDIARSALHMPAAFSSLIAPLTVAILV